MQFLFNRYYSRPALGEAFQSLVYNEGSGTNTSGALRTMRTEVMKQANGDRLSVRDIAIVVSDGFSTIERKLTAIEAQKLKDDGIRVFGIGIGLTANVREELRKEMETIGSDPDSEHVFNLEDFNALQSIEQSLIRRTCREAAPGMNCLFVF